jgi:undecaprenyl-diphosphatase
VNELEAFLLGLIQGATEFLPVSSSGHLAIGQALLDLRVPGLGFEVALHAATLLSVLIVYWRRVWALVAGAARGERQAWRYIGLLALATAPAGVVALAFGHWIERVFETPEVAGFALLVTGSFLWWSRTILMKGPKRTPGLKEALLMGVAQAFALIPGISRSGATVVTGLALGVDAREAAAFSFLMAVPAILGAVVLQVPGFREEGHSLGGGHLVLGGVVAALTGILAIRMFVRMLESRSFHRFAPYCWAVGGGFLLYLAIQTFGG